MLNRKNYIILLVLGLFIVLASLGCGSDTSDTEELLTVHFIDVGQGDSIFIQLPSGQQMLIDAGNNGDGEMIVDYIKKLGVNKIDYLVGTHPHADHIGGMDTVINSLDIGKIYMPRVTHTTQTFQDLLEAVQSKGLKVKTARAGMEIISSEELQAVVLAPKGDQYENINDYSAVIKLTFGKVSFLFTGDAEETSEKEMVNSGYDLQAQVLKVGHHGSSTSTTGEFLKAVNPEVAVICLAANNDYGHPHREVLDLLQGADVEVYRTDLNGTIVISTDGEDFTVESDNPPEDNAAVQITKRYVGSSNSDKFHYPHCRHVESIAAHNLVWFKDLIEANNAGYVPCASCKP
ncbi:ComEC/Rec2 family competence protein [Desulfofalx alkaliphila]|uniref:ComEC/Rec2 family competence protein n=1 Tax=Desulfofalx alkaliphila TaxID=105483 RepID=UPI0004E23310|nr:ComEC/Rec2 family competence protein [Desulfofalx alkaliphila]